MAEVRTIETGRATVEIVVWPDNMPWMGRYQTRSQIEAGVCRLVLSPDVFRNPGKANAAYRRFARKIRDEGMEPANVVFREMTSRASRNIFCVLSTTQSVFNTACGAGKLYVMESGIDEKRTLCAIVKPEEAKQTE